METQRVDKPWGWYEVIRKGNNYIVKVLRIFAGKRISLQSHQNREEYWTVVDGKGIFENHAFNIRNTPVVPGSQMVIRKGEKHRLSAHQDYDVEIMEVQWGENLSEDDIERFEDDFGRT